MHTFLAANSEALYLSVDISKWTRLRQEPRVLHRRSDGGMEENRRRHPQAQRHLLHADLVRIQHRVEDVSIIDFFPNL